jgi:NitT/TauT family transport system permease protein
MIAVTVRTEPIELTDDADRQADGIGEEAPGSLAELHRLGGLPVWTWRVMIGIGVLGFWQLASVLRWIDPIILSSPALIAVRMVELFTVELRTTLVHLQTTATELVTGYAIGATLGICLGTLLGRSTKLAAVLEPYIVGFYSIPKIALAPLFIIVLGIGIWSKIAVVIISAFFLVFYNTYAGMRNVSEELVNLARIMGASRSLIARKVLLPAAAPDILLGLRTSVPYSVIGAIIGEFIASNRGLGYFILYSANTLDSAGLFAGIVILVTFVMSVNQLLSWVEGRVIQWKPVVEAKVAL